MAAVLPSDPGAHGAPDADCDVVVIGAGAGGLTAAVVAAIEGLHVVVIEKSDRVGGTTAWSSGTVWIPGNHLQRAVGVEDDSGPAYLDALVGDRPDPSLRAAFLEAGPRMLEYLGERSSVRFRMYASQPDYRQELPGATLGGRALEPLPFDGRRLGSRFRVIRSPLPELMLFGGMMVTRPEAARLTRIGRNLDSIVLAGQLLGRYAVDRMRYPRGTRLVLGNALVARLYSSLISRQASVWLGATPERILTTHGRASGVVVTRGGTQLTVRARRAVVLAGGGFPASRELRERYLPRPVATDTAAYDGCTGDTLLLAQRVGAALGSGSGDNALWFPSSIFMRKDGSRAVYPHIVLDRGKPGVVAVDAAGRRFVDEAVSYHEFVRAMYAAHRKSPAIPAWLVCDRAAIWRYGLGVVRPLTLRLGGYVRSGYLKRGRTIAELAAAMTVDAGGLEQTIREINRSAVSGVDERFDRGGNAYDRSLGDATHRPNPCLGVIARAPYFAVALYPTPLGTSLGLRTDATARVLSEDGSPIAGLYACGNDMDSAFGGEYPGSGAELGLAMTFGFLAAVDAARG